GTVQVGGPVQVINGNDPLQVGGTVGVNAPVTVTDGDGPLTVDGSVTARPGLGQNPWWLHVLGGALTSHELFRPPTPSSTWALTSLTVTADSADDDTFLLLFRPNGCNDS